MGCATKTIKFTLSVFNTLWAILGVAVIVFGCLGWGGMPLKYVVGTLVLGGSILLISMFGCLGTIRESTRMLWSYVALLLVLLILTVVFMVLHKKDELKKYALLAVEDSWEKELVSPGAMDVVQKAFKCCGRNGSNDYLQIGAKPETLPSSCCKNNNCANPSSLYTVGCLSQVEKQYSDEPDVWRYFGWGLVGFDVILVVPAILLAIHYTNQRRRAMF